MAVKDQKITDRYAIYNGDCIDVMSSMPSESIDFSIYSPPFCGLYHYSSDARDLSNCVNYESFQKHYKFVIDEVFRLTKPGRLSAVHCCDVHISGANLGGDTIDLPGDIVRMHKESGWHYVSRYAIWKEPLAVRNRTMAKSLAHCQIVEDSTLCDNAAADYIVVMRKPGENKVPVIHPVGLTDYAGSRIVPHELYQWRGFDGNQIQNKYSHWIWRQYASAFWDDIRLDRVLPFHASRDQDDERHVHPLQLDVIERMVILRTNPGEIVFTPFMGVGSEVYGAVINGRKGIGIELKSSYYAQAVKNLDHASKNINPETIDLFENAKLRNSETDR